MSTTISTQKVVQVDPASPLANGEDLYILSEATYSSNVMPHNPDWWLAGTGTLQEMLKRVITLSSEACGGMVKHEGDHRTTPEAYVNAWLRAFKKARRLFTSKQALAAVNDRESPMRGYGMDSSRKRVREIDLPDVAEGHTLDKRGVVKPPEMDFDSYASAKLRYGDLEVIFADTDAGLRPSERLSGPEQDFIEDFAARLNDPQQAFQFGRQVKAFRAHRQDLPHLADTHHRIEMAREPRDQDQTEILISGFVKAIGKLPGPNGEGVSLAKAFKIAEEHAKKGAPMPKDWWFDALDSRFGGKPLCKLVPMEHGDSPDTGSIASSFKVEQKPGARIQPVALI